MVAPLSDEAFWRKAMEAVETGLKLKNIMLSKKLMSCKCECPRCGQMIHASLAGPKNHVRMACEGKCGMNLME
jgi:ribosomal protein S27AE